MIWGNKEESQNHFVEAKPTLGERLSDLLTSPEQRGGLKWLRVAYLVLTWPIRAILNTIADFFFFRKSTDVDGIRLRHFRHLLEGLPAVAAAIGVLAIAGVVVGRESYLRDVYRNESVKAYLNDRPEDARLFYERLFRLDGGTAETRLYLGLTLEKLNQKEEAEHLIRGVAEGDAGGDPRANRWVAAKILSDPKSFTEPKRLQEAHFHLMQAEQGLPNDRQVKIDLAKYHLALGRHDRAIPPLAAAAETDAALNLDLAKLYVADGKPELARAAIQKAELHFRNKLESHPAQSDTRLQLSTCLANLGQLDEAINVLKEGLIVDPNGPFPKAIAKIYVAGYDKLAVQGSTAHATMISALREALKYDPQSIDAAIRLANFGQTDGAKTRQADSDAAQEAQEILEELLVSGEHPPAVHMALGLKAWREEDRAAATWHFERAYNQDPSLAAVANNLAWMLAHDDPPNCERALAIINPIVERFPDSAHFRDTRGEIYLRLEQWGEALADLELALPSMRDNARIHESLAKAYGELGQDSMSKRHRDEAVRLKSATETRGKNNENNGGGLR